MSMRSNAEHAQLVQRVQDELKELYTVGQPLTLKKSPLASNTTRNATYKKETLGLNISNLNRLLSIDVKENYVVVEPQITIYELTSELLKYNKILLVTPEFKTITVGGALMGAALESSSFKWGQFNDSCLEIDLLRGDGSLMTLSPTMHPEVFYGISGSYGTLGVVTKVKLKITDMKKFVKVTYHSFKTFSEALNFIKLTLKESIVDYLDGVVFSDNSYIIITAIHSEKPQKPFYKPSFFSKWYYEHIQSVIEKNSCYTEWMELNYYLFRFDTGAFWMARYVQAPSLFLRLLTRFRLSSIETSVRHSLKRLPPNKNPSKFFHVCFNWALSSQRLYHILHRVPESVAGTLFLIHDFYVPLSRAETVFKIFRQKTGIYPIWLCPIKSTSTPQILSPHFVEDKNEPYFINMGFYGVATSEKTVPELSHELEREIVQYGGRKMLYSLTYYSEEEFKKIFNFKEYQELREQTKTENVLLSLEKKICQK